MQSHEAANKRFLTTAGNFNNRVIVDLVRKNFPEFSEAMPSASVKGGNYPAEGNFKIDNARSKFSGLSMKSLRILLLRQLLRSKQQELKTK
jgi:hypothetical protein